MILLRRGDWQHVDMRLWTCGWVVSQQLVKVVLEDTYSSSAWRLVRRALIAANAAFMQARSHENVGTSVAVSEWTRFLYDPYLHRCVSKFFGIYCGRSRNGRRCYAACGLCDKQARRRLSGMIKLVVGKSRSEGEALFLWSCRGSCSVCVTGPCELC